MARPKKNAGVAPMDKRILEIFAELTGKIPMSEITVTAVCRIAGCNKTTFYYHFATFADLVDRYLEGLDAEGLLEHACRVLLKQGTQGIGEKELSRLSSKYDHLCTLMALNPQGAFAQRMHEIMQRRVMLILDIGPTPTQRQKMLVEFAAGGFLSLLAYRGKEGNSIELAQIMEVFYPKIVPAIIHAAKEG